MSSPRSKSTSATAAAWRFSSAPNRSRVLQRPPVPQRRRPVPRSAQAADAVAGSQGETTPDVEVTQHPLFQVLAGRRNGFLPLLMVDYYYALQDDWQPPKDGSAQSHRPPAQQRAAGDRKEVRQGPRRRPAHEALLRRNAARPLDELEPQPGFPGAGERAGQLPRGRRTMPIRSSASATTSSSPPRKANTNPRFRFVLPS